MIDGILLKLDVIIPLLLFLITIVTFTVAKRKFSFSDIILIIFLLCQILLNALSNYYDDRYINNQWVYHLNCFATQILFAYYFGKVLNNKKLVVITSVFFILFFFIMMSGIQPYSKFPSFSYSLGSFFIVLYTFLNFQELINELPTTRILLLKEFWLLTGILTYFGSCFLIFISYNYLSEVSSKNVGILWRFHNFFLSAGCIIFFKSIMSKEWIPK